MTAKIELIPPNGVIHFKLETPITTPQDPLPVLPSSSYLDDEKVLEGKLTIHNPFDRTVCYRIQSTHPSLFHCSPTLGFFKQNATKNIRIFVTDVKKELNDAAKDKIQFQMKTIFAPVDQPFEPVSIWKDRCYAAWFRISAVVLSIRIDYTPPPITAPTPIPIAIPPVSSSPSSSMSAPARVSASKKPHVTTTKAPMSDSTIATNSKAAKTVATTASSNNELRKKGRKTPTLANIFRKPNKNKPKKSQKDKTASISKQSP